MLYQCCQDSRVVDIPVKLYLMISDSELLRICTEGNGTEISNPFYCSYAETQGVILTPEEVEELLEQESEEDTDSDQVAVFDKVDLNIESDYWD